MTLGGGVVAFLAPFGIKITIDYRPKKSNKCSILQEGFEKKKKNDLKILILRAGNLQKKKEKNAFILRPATCPLKIRFCYREDDLL